MNDCAFTFPVAGVTGQAARVTMTSYSSGDAKWWYEDVAVIPGQSYRFEDSYRSDVTTELVLQITHTDDSISHVFLGQVPASDGAWARMSIDAELPADARLVSLFHILAQPGYLTIDDASVKRVQAFVDVTQMLEMQSNGHDIAAHTRTHADLALLPDAQAQIEIEGSRAELLGAGALNVSSIAYPFGSYDLGVQQMVSAAGFSGARSTERGFNTKGSDRYNLKIQSMNRTTTLAELQAWIAQAMAEKTWLVLMFHQIDGDLTQSLGVTEAFFQESVDAIATSGIEVVTVHEGLSRMNP